MIIWTGWGILALLLPVAVLLTIQILVNTFVGVGTYENNFIVQFVSIIIGAIAVWFVGKRLNGKKGQVVIDKETGKELILQKTHTFFFIKLEYWAFIILALAIFIAVMN